MTPYVVGQWVRGDQFYGRKGLINEVLHGNRNCLWLIGTRRVGKTSLLKQLEFVTSRSPEFGYFPVFWDFQGAEQPSDLHDGFAEALLDAGDRLADIGIDAKNFDSEDLFRSISNLRRELRLKKLTLLLLGDEVEELVTVNETAPGFLRRLRRALQSPENIRTVLASKIKLWDLAYEETSTSPFLLGFTPPFYVRSLDTESATELIHQSQLPDRLRPKLNAVTVEAIRLRCNNHPFLLQLLCERFVDLGSLDEAIDTIASDQMVSRFFAVDFEMLTDRERHIIRIISEENEVTSTSIREQLDIEASTIKGDLQRLEQLGFIHRLPESGHALVNYFFKRWFSDFARSGDFDHDRASGCPTLRTPIGAFHSELGISRVIAGRYELRDKLGHGATGEVYKAYDTLLETEIAIKIIKEQYSSDCEAVERVRREVVLARDLSHANILKIYHLGDDEGMRFVTMQYIDGSDLADLIRKEAPFEIEKAVTIAKKIASALEVAHAKRVIHRDIKPSNILIDKHGQPQIADIGLARLVGGAGVTRDGIFVGTPAYASPEQIVGEPVDERSDLYALGVVLFEMVTGRRPFVAEFSNQVLIMHLESPPPIPQELRPETPSPLSDIILKCLSKDPEKRFQTPSEVLAALDREG